MALGIQMLRIGRRTFEIARSEFRAHVSVSERGWSASWSIRVVAQPLDVEQSRWEPSVRSHLPLELPQPDKLVGTRLGPLSNDEWGEPAFLLSDGEHDPVIDPVITFLERKGSSFLFQLRGKARNFEDESDDPIVFVAVDCWLPFDGVVVDEYRIEAATSPRIE
jgi:hypothetical protein